VSIDGWMNLANSHPQMNGMTFQDLTDGKGKINAITCRVYRKDREMPVEVTEYLSECYRATDPWKQWPTRMLRHKAAIQAIRYAFGFSGIIDQDEAERTVEGTATLVNAQQTAIAELNAEISAKPADAAQEPIKPSEDIEATAAPAEPRAPDLGPSYAEVAHLIGKGDLDLAGDLLRSVADEQQRAELDVMLRAAQKKAKKKAAEAYEAQARG